eukprot:TRINITY_DN285_c0_g1_i6.p1 TRINITY_DN285_c0_g1~~TRINITY_DN285_c0_g1_i6.p1  ORF type:complete len:1050 (+),score=205.58 TRINITY_DN285_c0_g1_i6:221-3151(+)
MGATVILKLYEKRTLKDVLIGSVMVPLKLQPGVETDKWFKVAGKGLGDPQIHLSLTWTSATFTRPIHVKIPQFRFLFERLFYYAGEVCQGVVLFYVGKPLKIKDLTLVFLGMQNAKYDNPIDGSTVNRSSILFKCAVSMINRMKTRVLPPGLHQFPFQFNWPQFTPSSLSWSNGGNSSGHTKYSVMAKFTRPGIGKPARTIQSPMDVLNLRIPASLQNGRPFSTSKLRVDIKANITEERIHAGDVCPIHVDVVNNSKRKLGQVQIELLRTFTFHSRPSRVVTVVVFTTNVKDSSIFPIAGGIKKSFALSFKVPFSDAVPPSSVHDASQNTMFQISYHVNLSFTLKGTLSSDRIKVQLPLHILAHVSPELSKYEIPNGSQATQSVVKVGSSSDTTYKVPPFVLTDAQQNLTTQVAGSLDELLVSKENLKFEDAEVINEPLEMEFEGLNLDHPEEWESHFSEASIHAPPPNAQGESHPEFAQTQFQQPPPLPPHAVHLPPTATVYQQAPPPDQYGQPPFQATVAAPTATVYQQAPPSDQYGQPQFQQTPAPGQPQYPPQVTQTQYQQPGSPYQPHQPSQPGQPQPQYPGQPFSSQPGQPQFSSQPGQPQFGSQPGQPQPQFTSQPGQPQFTSQPGQPQPQFSSQPGQPQFSSQPGQPQFTSQPGQPQPQFTSQPGQPQFSSQPGQPPFSSQPGQPQPQYPPQTQTAYLPQQQPGQPPMTQSQGQPQYPPQQQQAGQPLMTQSQGQPQYPPQQQQAGQPLMTQSQGQPQYPPQQPGQQYQQPPQTQYSVPPSPRGSPSPQQTNYPQQPGQPPLTQSQGYTPQQTNPYSGYGSPVQHHQPQQPQPPQLPPQPTATNYPYQTQYSVPQSPRGSPSPQHQSYAGQPQYPPQQQQPPQPGQPQQPPQQQQPPQPGQYYQQPQYPPQQPGQPGQPQYQQQPGQPQYQQQPQAQPGQPQYPYPQQNPFGTTQQQGQPQYHNPFGQ